MPKTDLIIESFPPIDSNVWISASGMLDVAIKKYSVILVGFGLLKILYDWCFEENGENPGLHIKTIGKVLMMIVFFQCYKTILIVFDQFIDILSAHKDIPTLVLKSSKNIDVNISYEKISTTGPFPQFLFDYRTAIIFMAYMRAIGMLFLIQVGPLAALLSWLPGSFRKSWEKWLKSYIFISCWSITLNILASLSNGLGAIQTDVPNISLIQSTVMFFMVLGTPMWTTILIGRNSLDNLVLGANKLAQSIVSLTSRLPIN